MASSDYEKLVTKMKELFGDKVVDPDVFPWQFKYQVNFAKFVMDLENENASDVSTT